MLDQLETEEQELQAQLKILRIKKQLALEAQAEQERIEADRRSWEVTARAEEFRELSVLNVTYRALRANLRDEGLRVISVHQDVRRLLSAALPSVSEQQWSQLVSALVTRLSNNMQRVVDAISSLKADSATVHYFNEAQDSCSIPIVLTGRLATMRPAQISEMITAYALSWGSATNFEDSE
jgi:hypothetical protein